MSPVERSRGEVGVGAEEATAPLEMHEIATALEELSVGVYFFDTSMRVRWLNREALRRIGFSHASEVIGRSWYDIHPEMETRREIYERVMAGESIELENARACLADGDRYYDVRYQPLRDRRGMVGFAIDVTKRHQAEQRLRIANRLESLGRLTGGIAHDLNNHLTAVFGYVDLSREQLGEDHPCFELLTRVIQVGRSSQALIEKLLGFARQRVMMPQLRALSALVEDIVGQLLVPLLDEDLELTLDLEPELGNVAVDASAIEQILVNLVVNARDAMSGGGSIHLRTFGKQLSGADCRDRYPDLNPGPYLVIEVSDNGSGMDDETREICFEPFFTTKQGGKNYGLGLSTCFGMVRQMDGVIEVDSAPGKGSTFLVILPRVEDGTEEPTKLAEPPASQALLGTETVLLVEDQTEVRSAVAGLLRRLGYRVLEAGNGGEALLLADQLDAPIHLLISDIVMPRVSGPTLAKRIMEGRPELRVIFMSGNAMHPTVLGEIDTGGTTFLAKPFRGEQLARTVRRVLDAPAQLGLSGVDPPGGSGGGPRLR